MATRKIKLTHPGKILREEFMEPVGLSAYALAKALDVPLPRVNDIVREKRSISPEMAVLLSAYFGTSDGYWINLQGHFDLEVAKEAKVLLTLGDNLPFVVAGARGPGKVVVVNAAAAHRLGLCGRSVAVHMPGGVLAIEVEDGYAMQMTGPVAKVADGVLSDEVHSTPLAAAGDQ